MKIQWDTVTWYSKLIAAILYAGTFCLAFYLGFTYARIGLDAKILIAPETSGPAIANVVFTCSNNRAIHAVFYKRSVSLDLSDSRSLKLPQTISASGARYATADEAFVFWNKGDTAFIEEGANQSVTFEDCALAH